MITETKSTVNFNFLTQAQYDAAALAGNINSGELYFTTDAIGQYSSEVTNSTATPSIELANNTLYSLTNTAITSITLTAAATLKYCSLDFTTPSTAPTLQYPSTWVMEGSDCSSGVFTVAASSNYRIGIEYSTVLATYVGTVQKVSSL